MKVLLINPAKYDKKGVREFYRYASIPPSGLVLLASRLKKLRNVQVRIVDEWIEDVPFQEHFDLVGISTLFSATFPRVVDISKNFRERGVPVVLAGTHATCAASDAAAVADSVILGEGEGLFEELIDDLGCGSGMKSYYKRDGFLDLQRQDYIEMDYSLLNLRKYIKVAPWSKSVIFPIQTSRGCPMNCAFCSIHITGGRETRYKPIAHVVKEILYLKRNYGATNFGIYDDNLTIYPSRFRELMKELKKLDIRFFCQVSSTIVRAPEMIDLLAQAGCVSACIGVESINRDSLEEVSKTFNDVRAYKKLFSLFRRGGVTALASMIFGFDHDGPEVFSESVRFLNTCKVPRAVFSILVPFPGTRVHEVMSEEGRIEDSNLSLYDLIHVVFVPRLMTKQQLQQGYWRAYEEFYRLGPVLQRALRAGNKSRLYALFGGLTFRRQIRNRLFPYNSGYRRKIRGEDFEHAGRSKS